MGFMKRLWGYIKQLFKSTAKLCVGLRHGGCLVLVKTKGFRETIDPRACIVRCASMRRIQRSIQRIFDKHIRIGIDV